MSNSAWDEPIVVQGAGLAEGQYELELTDIVKENKVVTFREAFRGVKGITGKEYDSLTAEQKALVDSTPVEFWPARDGKPPQEKKAFVDRIRFVFKEPNTGYEFKYAAQFDMPSKNLSEFITRATAATITPGEDIKFNKLFKPADKFVGYVRRNEKTGYMDLDVASVMKKELATPTVKGTAALSEKAIALLDYLKANYQGKPKRDIVDLYGTGQFGSYQETTSAWQEIMRNVKYTSDGKTLDFSEA